MKTRTEVMFLILSAPNAETADEIISENYGFKSVREKIAFLKGMFGLQVTYKANDVVDESIYFTALDAIISRTSLDNGAVKKTLTIPSWLNDMCIEKDINFSQTLQEALKQKLGLK